MAPGDKCLLCTLGYEAAQENDAVFGVFGFGIGYKAQRFIVNYAVAVVNTVHSFFAGLLFKASEGKAGCHRNHFSVVALVEHAEFVQV